MRSRVLLTALMCASVGVGCVAGAPPGFSDGDVWSAPLVGPLENGPLVVPVKVNGNGPYLFMIDPDSEVSSIDSTLANELDLYTFQGAEVLAENDTRQPVQMGEVKELQVGNDLTVANKTVRLHKLGTFWFGGRMVRGLLGRDVIADSLIVAIDRDRGMLYLGTQGNLPPPAGASRIEMDLVDKRYLVPVTLNEQHQLALHVDLGAPYSMVWPQVMEKAKLPRLRVRTTLHDELGIAREVDTAAMAAKVAIGPEQTAGIMLLPYADQRMRQRDLDGAIGHNLLSKFGVTVNWHKDGLWLKPRTATLFEMAAERMRRWGPGMDRCQTPGCVAVEKRGVLPHPGPPPEGEGDSVRKPVDPSVAPHLVVTREDWTRDFTYEAVIEAVDDRGLPIGLPLLRVTFPQGASSVTVNEGVEPYLTAAAFRAVDMSPFPRECESTATGMKCAWPMPAVH